MENSDVRTDHRTFVDAEQVTIHTTVWHAAAPRAVIQISHGLGEHSQRYDHMARNLAAQGFTVYADDHRGHGETGREQWGGDLSKLGRLGPGGLRATVEAIGQFTGMIREENPGLPVIFLGHSWGSLMGQMALDAGQLDVDAAVFSGSALRLPWTMNPGDLNARHKHLGSTGSEWLSRDPNVAAAFLADPLTFKADVLKLFGLADGIRLYGTPKPPHTDIPLLLLSGTDDSVCSEKALVELLRRYIAVGYTNAQLTMYEGARHEVYNETNRDAVYADVVQWITTHVLKDSN